MSPRDRLHAAIHDPARPSDDLARDRTDRTAGVLEFIGIEPGMKVLDLNAGSGYYSELLARVVGAEGRVIAHNHPGALQTLPARDFERRYGNARLPNTEQIFAPHDKLTWPPASLDAVLMATVYHDTYWFDARVAWGPVNQSELLARLYAALRPGGIIGVVDHYAAAGIDPAVSAVTTHRIDPAIVRRDFGTAGFELAAESDLLRSGCDDYTLSVFDAAVHGKTDRFLMRFRRPS